MFANLPIYFDVNLRIINAVVCTSGFGVIHPIKLNTNTIYILVTKIYRKEKRKKLFDYFLCHPAVHKKKNHFHCVIQEY